MEKWVGVIGGLLTAILALMKYFGERSRREKASVVGKAFSSTVKGLSAQEPAKQLAAAILLRRFFDPQTEQGAAHQPYQREAVAVIAALLRSTPTGELQKLLADGLAFAESLEGADLQHCNLSRAFWGRRRRAPVTNGTLRLLSRPSRTVNPRKSNFAEVSANPIVLTDADLSHADLSSASLRSANAQRAVFRKGVAPDAVFEDAHLEGADFRGCELKGARFAGAWIAGARFAGAMNLPQDVASMLDGDGVAAGEPNLRV